MSTVKYENIEMQSKLTVTMSDDMVRIVGNRKALKGFAEIISSLADMDPNEVDIPIGAYLHIGFFPGTKLTKKSISIEICQKSPKNK